MPKTEFTKTELEELIANEPDTKLKKKLLAMMEPEQDELTELHKFIQSVMDNLTTTFGKRRIVIPAKKKDMYGGEYWNSIKAGKCTLTGDLEASPRISTNTYLSVLAESTAAVTRFYAAAVQDAYFKTFHKEEGDTNGEE